MKKIREKFKSKVIKNISWLVGGKIFQMIISLIVSTLTARYLGPSNYGLIGYVTSYVTFISQICGLGLNNVIIKEIINHPKEEGKYIGTAIYLKFICSIVSILLFVPIMYLIHGYDKILLIISLLLSLSTLFNSIDVINYWYQSKLQSKKTTIISSIAYLFVALYRVYMLITNKSVEYFAFAYTLDFILIAALLVLFYVKDKGQKWTFSWVTGKVLLKQSYHFILSGVMVAIFSQTDRIMIGRMLDTTQVGLYTTAVTISGLWAIIPGSIIESMRPVIMNSKKENELVYVKRVKQLYSLIIWLSIFYGLFITIFARPIVNILYGKNYLDSVTALRVVVWYCSFSYLGSAKNIWLVCENKQKYEKWFTFFGALVNILINYILIPIYGIVGAAIATLITQILTNCIFPYIIKNTRNSSKYMMEALFLRGVIK